MSLAKSGWGLALVMLGAAIEAGAQQASYTDAEQAAIDRARKALEVRRQWADGLTVESIQPREWLSPDLGCGRSDSYGTPPPMRGYAIRFSGKGVPREVHVAGNLSVVCSAVALGSSKTAPPRVPMHSLEEMIEKARADLAMRLGGKPAEITLAGWKPVQLPVRVLRCEVPNGEPGEAAMPGYRIVLVYKARDYTYHSDMQTVTACPRIEAN